MHLKSVIPLGSLALALVLNSTTSVLADPPKVAVSGGWQWSIIPPFTGPGELIPLPSGNFLLRDVLASGPISFTGEGVFFEGVLTASINGNLDETLSGPVFAPSVVTTIINGEEVTAFEGFATVQTVGLLSEGRVMLHGTGPFVGTTLHYSFVEIPPADVYEFEGYLLTPPQH